MDIYSNFSDNYMALFIYQRRIFLVLENLLLRQISETTGTFFIFVEINLFKKGVNFR